MSTARYLLAKVVLCLIVQGVVVSARSLTLYPQRPLLQQSNRRTIPNAYNSFVAYPNQLRSRTDVPTNEKPSSENANNEKPASEGKKDKMGSFKIDDGDVIGIGMYDIKPDGQVAMDIKIKINPGKSPALSPAPCPTKAPSTGTKECETNLENPPTTTTAAPVVVTTPGEAVGKTTPTPESNPKNKPGSNETNAEGSKEQGAKPESSNGGGAETTAAPTTAKATEGGQAEGSGAGETTPQPETTKAPEVTNPTPEENAEPTTKGEDKPTAAPGGSGESPGGSGDATKPVSDQGRLGAMAKTKNNTKLHLASKALPELNKLKAALSDAAATWAFNLRNGRRRGYMERPRVYYTHQHFIPNYSQ